MYRTSPAHRRSLFHTSLHWPPQAKSNCASGFHQHTWVLPISELPINVIIHYALFCDWLLLLSIISSMFISVAAHERISSLFKCWIIFHFLPFNPPPYSSIYHLSMTNFLYPFIHQWTLWMLYLLAIVNNAAINMRVQISLQDTTFNCFDKYSELGCWIML